MSIQKFEMRKKKYKRKTLTNVIKLVGQLKDESLFTSSSKISTISDNNTVIDLDASINEPIISMTNNAQNKHDFIEICDEEDAVTCNRPFDTLNINQIRSPIYCSTPRKAMLEESEDFPPNNNNSLVENLNTEITNLTKEINNDSYLTIDLTDDSILPRSCSNSNNNTVIDLVNTSDMKDCTIASVSNTSMSGDSDVTVLNMAKARSDNKPSREMRNFVRGITKLDSKEKGKLLKLITETIFNGCNIQNSSSKFSLGFKVCKVLFFSIYPA